jgi:hypothetical protein
MSYPKDAPLDVNRYTSYCNWKAKSMGDMLREEEAKARCIMQTGASETMWNEPWNKRRGIREKTRAENQLGHDVSR